MPQRIDGLTMLPPVSLPIEKPDQPRRRRRAGPRARPGGALFEKPGIHRLAAEPDIVERQRAQAQLRHQHRARIVQPLHHRGVLRGNAVAERLGAIGCRNAGGIHQVLRAPRNPVERAAILAGGDLLVGLPGLRQRQVAGQRDDAAQLGVEALQSFEV